MPALKTTTRSGPPYYYYDRCVECGRRKGFSQRPRCASCGHSRRFTAADRNKAICTLYYSGVDTATIARAFRLQRGSVQKVIRSWRFLNA